MALAHERKKKPKQNTKVIKQNKSKKEIAHLAWGWDINEAFKRWYYFEILQNIIREHLCLLIICMVMPP